MWNILKDRGNTGCHEPDKRPARSWAFNLKEFLMGLHGPPPSSSDGSDTDSIMQSLESNSISRLDCHLGGNLR